jgi:DNA-binding beta-propeller fold protein YncE
MTILSIPAGTNCSILEGVPSDEACLGGITYLAVDPATNDIYYSDTFESRVRKIDGQTQEVTTVAGLYENANFNQEPENNPAVPATSAALGAPQGVAFRNGLVYITDSFNMRIRVVNMSANSIRTVVGNGDQLDPDDPDAATEENIPATSAKLRGPIGNVAFDQAGNMYFIDYRTIRRVDAQTGLISSVVNSLGKQGELHVLV